MHARRSCGSKRLISLSLRNATRLISLTAALLCSASGASAAKVAVVAAESSYGSMVEAVGGEHVAVTSLLDSPSVNPHEFSGSAKIGRLLTEADLVVMNGAGLDAWMDPLLAGTDNVARRVIKASEAGSAMIMPDDNWHLFYSPRIMLATASHVASALAKLDAAHASAYQQGLADFRAALRPIYEHVQQLIAEYPDVTVTATVPIYGYMIDLLGYRNRYHDVQFASMRGAEPSAQQVKRFIQGLQQGRVDLLIYNVQVKNRLTSNLIQAAKEAGIPAVGVSAIPLHGENYAQWQVEQLEAIEKGLDRARSGS